MFQAGNETQYSKLIEGDLHPVWDADQRFRFSVNTKRADDLRVQVWAYHQDSSEIAWPVLIGSVTIPIPAFSPTNTDASSPVAYPLQVPNQFEIRNRRSMIYLKICQVASGATSNALASSGANKGCIICGLPVIPGSIYCAACIRVFGQKMLTKSFPIWFIPRQRIMFDSEEQATHRGMITKVCAGALEHDSSIDVWSISPSKEYDVKLLAYQIDLWFMLNHPHILRLFGACHVEQPVLCVCEHAVYENIAVFLSKSENKQFVWMVLYQTALGLYYLHSQRIVHGDIRCENIVVGIDGKIKLCNFGFSYRRQGSSLLYACAQQKEIRWMTPERISGDDMGRPLFESDIYDFGMTIIEAITGYNAWGQSSTDDIIKTVLENSRSFERPPKIADAVWSIVSKMCSYDREERPAIAEVVTSLEKLTYPEPDDVMDTDMSLFTLEDAFALAENKRSRQMKREKLDQKLPAQLAEVQIGDSVRDLYLEMEEMKPMCNHILMRFDTVKQILLNLDEPKQKEVAICYASISDDICLFISEFGSIGTIAQLLCATTMAEATRVFHTQFDHLLRICHLQFDQDWECLWNEENQARQEAMKELISKPGLIQSKLQDTKEKHDVLRCFFNGPASSIANHTTQEQDFIKHVMKYVNISQAENAPTWFLSPHEIILKSNESFARGSYGSVRRGTWNGVDVVIKIPHSQDDKSKTSFLKETEIWSSLSNPHVVRLFGACHIGDPFFVCEFASKGTLSDYSSGEKSVSNVWGKLLEAALGLKYIHMKNVVHQDIKGDNILVGADGKAKIADFGLSFVLGDEGSLPDSSQRLMKSSTAASDVGAIPWKAPEIIRERPFSGSSASDIYSLGMCVLEVVSGKIPWGSCPVPTVRYKVLNQKALPQQPDNMNDSQWALIRGMCAWEPAERFSIDQVVERLKDIYFKELKLEYEVFQQEEREDEEKQQRKMREAESNKSELPVASDAELPAEWMAKLPKLSAVELVRLQAQIGERIRSTGNKAEPKLGQAMARHASIEDDRMICAA